MTRLRHRKRWGIAAAAVGPLLANAALADTLGGAHEPPIAWWRVAAALLLCLILAVGAALALRGRMRGLPPLNAAGRPSAAGLLTALWSRLPSASAADIQELRLMETIRLSHQIDVCRVRFRDEDYLLAASAQGLVLLGKSPARPGEQDPAE